MWIYEIWDADGNLVTELEGARDRSFKMRLNSINAAQCYLDINDSKATRDILHTGRNELRIRKGRSYFFGGILINLRDKFDADSGLVPIKAFSYEYLLEKRLLELGDASVTTGYSSTDVGEIISALIDEAQAKQSMSLTEGTITTSLERDRENYRQFDEVWHEIKLLTRYVDFEITPLKVWNVYYPQKGAIRSGIEFVYNPGPEGQSQGNIFSGVYERDATNLITEMYTMGQGIDDAMKSGNAEDTGQQGVYGLLQESRYYDSDNETVLDEEASKQLNKVKAPVEMFTNFVIKNIEGAPKLGDFFLGDTVNVKFKHGELVNINSQFRIESIDVSISDEDIETLSLGMVNA